MLYNGREREATRGDQTTQRLPARLDHPGLPLLSAPGPRGHGTRLQEFRQRNKSDGNESECSTTTSDDGDAVTTATTSHHLLHGGRPRLQGRGLPRLGHPHAHAGPAGGGGGEAGELLRPAHLFAVQEPADDRTVSMVL